MWISQPCGFKELPIYEALIKVKSPYHEKNCLKPWHLRGFGRNKKPTENGRSMTTFDYCSVNHQSGLQSNTFSKYFKLSILFQQFSKFSSIKLKNLKPNEKKTYFMDLTKGQLISKANFKVFT